MRSVTTGSAAEAGDLDDRSSRARLRDTAIEVFARDGFGATVRTIAAVAGVSPGLLIHHFGSKAGLRAECDAYVLNRVADDNRAGVQRSAGEMPLAGLMTQMDGVEDNGPRTIYLIRSLQSGGAMVRELLERLAADSEETMRAGVAAGTITASVDEAARARYLLGQSLGGLLVDVVMHPPADWSDSGAIVRSYIDRVAIPAVEVATHGFLADDAVLDAVLGYQDRRRDTGSDNDASSPEADAPAPGGDDGHS